MTRSRHQNESSDGESQVHVPASPKPRASGEQSDLDSKRAKSKGRSRSQSNSKAHKGDNKGGPREKTPSRYVDSGEDEAGDPERVDDPDGLAVAVDASEDDFPESEPESEGEIPSNDSPTQQDREQSPHSSENGNSDSDEETEVILARRKLAKKISRDPKLHRAFDSMVEDEIQTRGNTPIQRRSPLVKSPSDTTLYTPALRKVKETSDVINQISNFVDEMRIEEDRYRKRRNSQSRS